MTRITLATANTPGAVAIIQLHGPDAHDVLARLSGRESWPARRASLCGFAGIDEGLAVLIKPDTAQLMPHGGPRVVQKLIAHLTGELGCQYDATPDPRELYPEAGSPIEADMLDAIAKAASPAAIDLLADQPAIWRSLLQQTGNQSTDEEHQTILHRSATLNRLITPPTVALVGPANAGKSTLTNALMGKTASIVSDQPGTTRDWVGGLVEMAMRWGEADGVVVQWIDTPGLRISDDRVEQQAIGLARKQVELAGVVIAMRGVDQDWPEAAALSREPDLWVVNKVDEAADEQGDQAGESPHLPLKISALHGRGLACLEHAVTDRLGFFVKRLSCDDPWAFSPRLKAWCLQREVSLEDYL